MREIKFRAWITIEPKTIEDEYETRMIYGIERAAEHNPPPHNMLSLSDFEEALELAGRIPPLVILMQFTGLRDKNGKEIYEGDIVEYENNNCGYGPPRDQEISRDVIPDITEHLDHDMMGPWWKRGEVIGNIWENKELLR
jgi:uncharacterized phage protein (TIGR01671 family)